jgi:hypothetical protein
MVLKTRQNDRGGSNRFAARRLDAVLDATAKGQFALQALALTPTLQTH